jgi:hypothetical protein
MEASVHGCEVSKVVSNRTTKEQTALLFSRRSRKQHCCDWLHFALAPWNPDSDFIDNLSPAGLFIKRFWRMGHGIPFSERIAQPSAIG